MNHFCGKDIQPIQQESVLTFNYYFIIMIKQAFAKNYMPSGGGGNYKYYKINNPEILDTVLDYAHMPVIDVIFEGELLSAVRARNQSFDFISAIRIDTSYYYPLDTSMVTGKPDSYVSITGDLIKLVDIVAKLSTNPPSKEEYDIVLSMFQEISKEEYEAMITK